MEKAIEKSIDSILEFMEENRKKHKKELEEHLTKTNKLLMGVDVDNAIILKALENDNTFYPNYKCGLHGRIELNMKRLELNNKLKEKGIYFKCMEINRNINYIEYVYEDDYQDQIFTITLVKNDIRIEMGQSVNFNPQLLRLIADLADLLAKEDRVNYSEVFEG